LTLPMLNFLLSLFFILYFSIPILNTLFSMVRWFDGNPPFSILNPPFSILNPPFSIKFGPLGSYRYR